MNAQPRRARFLARGRATLLSTTACLGALLGACADEWLPPDGSSGTTVDAGADPSPPPWTDAGSGDFADAGATSNPDDASIRGGFESDEVCFDAVDNDLSGVLDCADPSCALTPVCCVGSAEAACCTGTSNGWSVPSDAVASCTPGPTTGCDALLGIATPFGSDVPRIEGGGIVPGGSEAEAGLAFSGRFSPRSAILTVSATVAAPTGCASCLDGVALSLGLTTPGRTVPEALVGVLVSGSRGDASLVVGGRTVARHGLPDSAAHTYTLVTHPDGAVSLSTDFDFAADATLEVPDADVQVLLHGLTSNRSAAMGPPARVLQLEVASRGCDRPGALDRGAPTLVTGEVPAWGTGSSGAPTLATSPITGALMAFASGGSIWLAHPVGSGFEVTAGAGPALAQGSMPGMWFDHPDLLALDSRWVLFVSARTEGGVPNVLRVDGPEGWEPTFAADALRPVFTPEPSLGPDAVIGLESPSAARVGDTVLLAARAVHADGHTGLVLLSGGSAPDASFTLQDVCGTGCTDPATETSRALHVPSIDAFAFDHDEVDAPSLQARRDGVTLLYFAGRRGTRWAVGLLVGHRAASPGSPFVFRPASPSGPLLAGSGIGLDRLGVRDPEPFEDAGGARLFYTGSDGVSTRVLAASMR